MCIFAVFFFFFFCSCCCSRDSLLLTDLDRFLVQDADSLTSRCGDIYILRHGHLYASRKLARQQLPHFNRHPAQSHTCLYAFASKQTQTERALMLHAIDGGDGGRYADSRRLIWQQRLVECYNITRISLFAATLGIRLWRVTPSMMNARVGAMSRVWGGPLKQGVRFSTFLKRTVRWPGVTDVSMSTMCGVWQCANKMHAQRTPTERFCETLIIHTNECNLWK